MGAMGTKLALILLSLVLASCGAERPARMHTVDVVTDDGALAFEIKMNGCWVYDAVVHNRSAADIGGIGATLSARSGQNENLGSINMVFPATRAGARARADNIRGATGMFKTARDSRAGLKPRCENVGYTLRYY
ncbi:MAG: hypothetical protein IIA68_06505 [Proteobacteria bacterium]|nr:hypothetical protein [Pseudomonadota bacterium]